MKPAPSIRGLMWQCTLLLRLASVLVPKSQRQDWYREWHAEVWHWIHFLLESGRLNPRSKLEVVRHCWGAFADATWHRFDQDHVRHTLAGLRRSPYFCLGSISLGLLLALVATGFAPTIRSGFTRLPYAHPESVAVLSFPGHYSYYPDLGLFWATARWSRVSRTTKGVAAYSFRSSHVPADGKVLNVRSVRVSSNFFETLGSKAELGRLFRTGDERDCRDCIVLTDQTWKATFHGDPMIVGKSVGFPGEENRVIGVLPADFVFLWPEAAIWALPPPEGDLGDCGDRIGAVLRLSSGATLTQVRQEFRQLAIEDHESVDSAAPKVEMMVSRPRQAAKVYLIFTMLSLLGGLLLVSTRLAVARTRKLGLSTRSILRWWVFLVLKTILLLSVCFVGSLELTFRISGMLAEAVRPLAGPISTWLFIVTSLMALSWSIHDQSRRCRVCLKRLSNEASVGSSSYLLLDWWGTELVCSDGHGLLHVPEMKSSWLEFAQWVHLDESWKPLFEEHKAVSTR